MQELIKEKLYTKVKQVPLSSTHLGIVAEVNESFQRNCSRACRDRRGLEKIKTDK